MKKFLSILLSAVMVLSLAACGAKEATPNGDQSNTVNEDGTRDTYVTIKVGTGHNKNSFFYTGLAEFERLVEENTKGAVQIDIFTDGALGSEGEMAEGLTMGTGRLRSARLQLRCKARVHVQRVLPALSVREQ